MCIGLEGGMGLPEGLGRSRWSMAALWCESGTSLVEADDDGGQSTTIFISWLD